MNAVKLLLCMIGVFAWNLATAQAGPQIQSDGSMLFSLKMPNAKKVTLSIEGFPTQALSQDAKGIWSIRVASLPADIYGYVFNVDGVPICDPTHSRRQPAVSGPGQSLLLVPSAKGEPWERRNVPHGTIHDHTFRSDSLGDQRGFVVYTPPGYEKSKARLPVLYLLHGVNDTERSWTEVGQVPTILDNLIASKSAVPMIVVMPLGYGFSEPDKQLQLAFGNPETQKKIMKGFEQNLVREVMPEVERLYRTKADSASRAIAGLSMGGAQALYVSWHNPKLFSRTVCMSGAFIMLGTDFESFLPGKPQIPGLDIWCGKQDFLLGNNRSLQKWLTAKGLQVSTSESEGSHTWMVWRRNLVTLASGLFRGKSDRIIGSGT